MLTLTAHLLGFRAIVHDKGVCGFYCRMFLCTDCAAELTHGFTLDEGEAWGGQWTSKGYDCGLDDYHCPCCGTGIVGGEEVILRYDL